jgi:hypothetical protein
MTTRTTAVAASNAVCIAELRPPPGALTPGRDDPAVQAALEFVKAQRRPADPLRLVAVESGHALADANSYLWWWALRRADPSVDQLDAVWVVFEPADEAPSTSLGGAVVPVLRLGLDAIRADTGLQSRATMNDEAVAEYARLMREGDRFPPVTVFRDGEGILWLADGFHRLAAARLAERRDIEAELRVGDRQAALLHSVGANARHGLNRTNEDKRRCILLLLQDAAWSTRSARWIARVCGVSQPMVTRVRDSNSKVLNCSAKVATADGRTMSAKRPRPDRGSGEGSHGGPSPAALVAALDQAAQRFAAAVRNLAMVDPVTARGHLARHVRALEAQVDDAPRQSSTGG